jgi:hypothetical protein
MTQDEIIEIAKKCGWDNPANNMMPLYEFAKLVAQHEREACAEVCKKHADVYAGLEGNPTAKSAWAACIDNRDTILARGQA